MESGSSPRAYVDRPIADVAAALVAARVAADAWALPSPVLVRAGMNVICAAGDVIIRASEPTGPARAPIDLAAYWLHRSVRVARPARSAALTIDGFAVTAWDRLEVRSTPVDWKVVGALIRMVHAADPASLPVAVPLPTPAVFPWWQLEALLADVLPDLDQAAASGLRATIERHAGWSQLSGRVVCHGDVHPGNVVMSDDGPVLLDWDLLCWAPPGWDHAPMMRWAERWGGREGDYDDFADGYGASLRDDPAAIAIAELRLVAATLMRVVAGRRDAAARAEAELRLRYWRNDVDAPHWTAQ